MGKSKDSDSAQCREDIEYQDTPLYLETATYRGIVMGDTYKCPWCGKHFNSRSFMLNQHIPDCLEREKALYGVVKSTDNKERWDMGVT
jgi:hypothetical protein